MAALPPEVAKVVRDFEPDGTVRGVVHFRRWPPGDPEAPPNADADGVAMHAELDLNDGFMLRWVGMPYPIDSLTGHLDLKPDRWTFHDMRGRNGRAVLEASGQVRQTVPGRLPDVELAISADHLEFDQQLRDALPPEWQKTWETLNPSGASRVEAHIRTGPDHVPHYHLTVVPEPAETRVRLVLTPILPGPDGRPRPGREIRLPLDGATSPARSSSTTAPSP